MKSRVFKPQEIYSNTRNVAPDLILRFGELCWHSIGTVGHAKLHVQENDTDSGGRASSHGWTGETTGLHRRPDDCNNSQYGMFILTAPNCPLSGEYEGARLLDMAPTLLDLAGHGIPETMQGRSLVAGMEKKGPGGGSDEESQKIVHDRLAGLGYV
jgi:predicted AlkP superfamily phosphohydrolase/phosphomutase